MAPKAGLLLAVVLLLVIILPCQGVMAAKKQVQLSRQWSGSVDDLDLRKAVPEVILDAKTLDQLWKAWKVLSPVPDVDFSRELVVVQTTQGSRLRLLVTLDEQGDLQVGGMATRDLRPGFRYVIGAVSREGVKTVNGQPLPGEAKESLPEATATQDIRAFGAGDVEVRSVKSLSTEKLNAAVMEASQKGESWPKQAVLTALKFTGEGLKGHTKIIEINSRPEQQETAVVTVFETGYPDDAVQGERWRLWLERNSEGVWTIKKALWAWLCSRPGRQFYAAEKCP